MRLRLGADEIRYIGLFESITGATVKDCLVEENDDTIVFVVKEGEMGLAIGKKGANLAKVREMINKGIDIVEYSEDPTKFLENLMKPAKIINIKYADKDGKKVASIEVSKKDRGIAIGRSGKNIKRAKVLLKRHQTVDDVMIM
ncbi:MAG TPA: NusA-like transcription termination signal-binding factor [Candidatus Methanofastidiosa archaeon]|nr:NusA-like transcription termination signal-binding factor [Candidatus Methanofastidiosa archaeon]